MIASHSSEAKLNTSRNKSISSFTKEYFTGSQAMFFTKPTNAVVLDS